MNIKSCRVCGGSADTDVDGLDWQVLCRGRCFEARYDSEQEAIEAWNTRASMWIPVSERLPTDHHPAYLVLEPDGSWHKAYIDGWGSDGDFEPSHWIHSEGNRCELNEFTHWQPVEIPE